MVAVLPRQRGGTTARPKMAWKRGAAMLTAWVLEEITASLPVRGSTEIRPPQPSESPQPDEPKAPVSRTTSLPSRPKVMSNGFEKNWLEALTARLLSDALVAFPVAGLTPITPPSLSLTGVGPFW